MVSQCCQVQYDDEDEHLQPIAAEAADDVSKPHHNDTNVASLGL